MEFKDKLKQNWISLHTWVKVFVIIWGILILIGLVYLIKWLFLGFGNWIGKSLGIPGY